MAGIKPEIGFMTVIVRSPLDFNNEQIKEIKEQVRQLMEHTEECTNVDDCETFVQSIRYEYIFIIVTIDFIDDVFARNIHQIRHVRSIFLLDPNKTITPSHINHLRKSSYKMQEQFISSYDLIQSVEKCLRDCANQSDLLLSTLSGCSSGAMTTNIINNIADFAELWFSLYIDLLFDMPLNDLDSELHRFAGQSRRHFARNPSALEQINEFEEIYSPHGALYYYSCDSFVYRLVNRVLRRQAIDGILDFRFFLLHIRDQLQAAHKDFVDEHTQIGMPKTFFRGQSMSFDEIEILQKKYIEGTLITTNSYFSTSENPDIARIFAGKPSTGIVSVLFEITAQIKDPTIQQRKPFAKIARYSTFGDAEGEVLFSIGSFFKIDKIYEEGPSFWIVKIIFVDEDDKTQSVIEDFRTLRTCSSEEKIIKIGHLLANHPHKGMSQAKAFYQLMTASKISDTLAAACIAGLGWVALKERNEILAIEQQEKALGIYKHLSETQGKNLAHLYVTSYNCIGASFRLIKKYRQALQYYKKAEELSVKIPIDKYAMYDGYRNVISINIASMYKLTGEINLAWDTYKKILAYEMNSSTRFHGHTYLTIAQAGLYEAKINNDINEYERCSQNWKAFLDISLTSMSSSYRRSIISGVLLIGFEYAHNEQTRTMAVDYFHKVINISHRYVDSNRDDYYIVLECLNQLSRLYTKKKDYNVSIKYALDALDICRENDLANIIECYESIVLNYEQQLSDQIDDLTPDDIRRIIVDSPFAPNSNNIKTMSATVLTFIRAEFTFGQYSKKTINRKLLEEPNLVRRLAYCRLKLAALEQSQGYIYEKQKNTNDDDISSKMAQKHKENAYRFIKLVAESLKDDHEVQKICANNMNYLNGRDEDFNLIINNYEEVLISNQTIKQKTNFCIGEDAFCYIAHLYARKKEIDKELQWYNASIQYFESHGHICDHTVICFRKLAHFHEIQDNFIEVSNVLKRLVIYLLKNGPCSFIQTSIEPIVMEIVRFYNERTTSKQVIAILQDFINILIIQPANDTHRIDEQFRKLLAKCMSDLNIVNQAYGSYLEMLLRYKPLSLDSYIRAVEPAFRQAIEVYHACEKYHESIETYQKFIELLVNSTTDHLSTESAFKSLALQFEKLKLYDIALDMYSYLSKFIIKYQRKEDTELTGFVIVRFKLLKNAGANFNENIQDIFIQLMIFYHNIAEPHFVFSQYFQSRNVYVDRCCVSGIYIDLLEFCIKYRSELYEEHMKNNIAILENRPAELIAFITTNRVNYEMLILHIFEKLKNRTEVNYFSRQLSCDFETAAKEWISLIENDRTIYWSQVLHRLLELQSIDDECLARCRIKMGDMKPVVSLFNTNIYGDPALRFNSNACRRYLRYVYPQASTEERQNLEYRYQNHFYIEMDSFSDHISFEILPLE